MTVDCPACKRILTRDTEGFAKCARCGCELFIFADSRSVACCDVSRIKGAHVISDERVNSLMLYTLQCLTEEVRGRIQ